MGKESVLSALGGTLGNALGDAQKEGANAKIKEETLVGSSIEKLAQGILNVSSNRFNSWFDEIVKQSGVMGQNVYNAMNAVETASNVIADKHLGMQYNFGMKEYMEARKEYQDIIHRRLEISNNDIEKLAALNKVIGKSGEDGRVSAQLAAQLAGNYEKYGASISKLTTGIGKTYSEASKSGLNMEKITDNIKSNIEIAAQYGFKNGIDGLQKMAIYAEKIGISIQTATRAADRLQDLSSAAEAAGKLSALGGNFATMSNPLEMMYDSFNDVEDLQKKIGSMVQGMAHFDYNKGQLNISAVDRMRIKQAAEAMGMTDTELYDSAMKQGKQQFIESQFGDSVSDEIKNLVANVGTIQETEEGSGNYEAGAVIKGQFYNAGEIAANEDLQEELRRSQFTDSENLSNIAENTRGIFDKLNGTDIDLNAATMAGQRGVSEKTRNYADKLPDNEYIKSMQDKYLEEAKNAYSMFDNTLSELEDSLSKLSKLDSFTDIATSVDNFLGGIFSEIQGLVSSSDDKKKESSSTNSEIKAALENNTAEIKSLIKNITGGKTAATGGFIGGQPHKHGGTFVEAERGEFIVNAKTMSDPIAGPLIQGANKAGASGPVNNDSGYFEDGGFPDTPGDFFKNTFLNVSRANNSGNNNVLYVKFSDLSGNIGINGNIGSEFSQKQKQELTKIILTTIEDKLNSDKVQKTGIGVYNG